MGKSRNISLIGSLTDRHTLFFSHYEALSHLLLSGGPGANYSLRVYIVLHTGICIPDAKSETRIDLKTGENKVIVLY